MKKLSKAYQNFERYYLNPQDWSERKDGPPTELIDGLSDEEKEMAEEALLQQLIPGDFWPVVGLGHLRSKKASAKFREFLPRSRGMMKAYIAAVIWEVESDAGMIDVIISLLEPIKNVENGNASELTAVEAIHCLGKTMGEGEKDKAKIYLENLGNSPNYLIRYNAERVLEKKKSGIPG